ncbi:MAG: hypothetical protein K0S74_176 [Chlamydiales bacterium]|jgi:hypothetical protein|nr:hypothetical protein [Chlamydiales bacterium]
MKEKIDCIDTLWAHYPPLFLGKSLNWQLRIKARADSESYHVEYASGTLYVEAGSKSTAEHAAWQLYYAAKAGCLCEWLGDRKPLVGTRIFWVGCSKLVPLSEFLALAVPSWWGKTSQMEFFYKSLMRWGYNSVILGWLPYMGALKEGEVNDQSCLQSGISYLKEKGIKIFVKFYFLQNSFKENHLLEEKKRKVFEEQLSHIQQFISFLGGVVWEGNGGIAYRKLKNLNEFTEIDIVLKEIQLLELLLPPSQELIYLLPSLTSDLTEQQAVALNRLEAGISARVTLAFSSRMGEPISDYLPPHPIWQKVRSSLGNRKSLSPILNGGLINQGEGIWPLAPYDTITDMMGKATCSYFKSTIVLGRYLPLKGSLLDLSLWLHGIVQWDVEQVNDLLRIGMCECFPGVNDDKARKIFVQVRQIALEYHYLSLQGVNIPRDLSEKLYNRLIFQVKSLDLFLETLEIYDGIVQQTINDTLKDKKLLWNAYTAAFSNAIKPVILRLGQELQVSTSLMAWPDDKKNNFCYIGLFYSLPYYQIEIENEGEDQKKRVYADRSAFNIKEESLGKEQHGLAHIWNLNRYLDI